MKQQIKNGIIFGLTASMVFTLFGVVYAAWNDTVSNGDTVSASSWNALVEKVNDIDIAVNLIESVALNITTISSFNTNLIADADGFITFSAINNSSSAVCRIQGIVNGSVIAFERSNTSNYDYVSITFPVNMTDTYQLSTSGSCGALTARYAKLTGGA